MERNASGIDESRDFFLTEDRWEAAALFRIGSLRDAPGLLECLDVEEPQAAARRFVTVPMTPSAFETAQPGIRECAAGPNGPAGG
jgi:hypothetical protein